MSSAISQPSYADTNRGPRVIVLVWVECALAVVTVILRLWVRYFKRALGWDDWTMLFTLLIFILWCSFVTDYALLGGFRHLYYLTTTGADTQRITFINYIIQFIITFSYAPAKLSVGLLVLRVIGSISIIPKYAWYKWLIVVTLTLVWCTTIVNCVMTYAQCDPPSALWNPDIQHRCWDPEIEPHFAYFSSSLNIFTDTILAIIPASTVYTLHMDSRKRTSLVIILSLGIIAAICGIVKTTYLPSLSAHSDITWNTYNLIAWAGSELFVLIFCGSIPPLRPLWDSFELKALGLGGSGYYNKGSGSSGNGSNNPFSQYSQHGAGGGEFSPLTDDRIHVSTDIEVGSVSSAKPLK
ncbi:hypothetical protein ZTR_11392 [Talaromyces verruculosus]|nr:hypothetical protein ZTR_11392 [Talaromyces verruculosus]